MATAYIGIGSNLGDKRQNCLKAVEMIGQIHGCELRGCSDWYLTKPVGVEDQDWYVNGAVVLSTSMGAQQLLGRLMAIEADMGRVRRQRWESRIIDLDILLFGREVVDQENLTIPHPLMHLRKFVLVPMVELAPDLIHPSLPAISLESVRLDNLPLIRDLVQSVRSRRSAQASLQNPEVADPSAFLTTTPTPPQPSSSTRTTSPTPTLAPTNTPSPIPPSPTSNPSAPCRL